MRSTALNVLVAVMCADDALALISFLMPLKIFRSRSPARLVYRRVNEYTAAPTTTNAMTMINSLSHRLAANLIVDNYDAAPGDSPADRHGLMTPHRDPGILAHHRHRHCDRGLLWLFFRNINLAETWSQ